MYLRKCIQDYGLIEENDVITVGLSGGKDSLVLLYGLRKLMDFYPVHFSLRACTVDPGFGTDYSPLSRFSESLGIPYTIEHTEIWPVITARNEAHPCALCANMRRGALVNGALAQNSAKIALAHHKDDYLSTLMMSLLFEGRFYTFAPMTRYEDREVRIIRPMLYVPEGAIRNIAEELSLPVLKNPCPMDHRTKREEMQELISSLQKQYPDIKDRLLHAVETSDIPDWKEL